MSLKKYLLNHIRGWLPREPNLPSHQQATTQTFITKHKRKVAYVLIIFGGGFVGAFLAALGNFANIYSRLGAFWTLITLIAIYITAFIGALIIGRKYRKETQKEAKL